MRAFVAPMFPFKTPAIILLSIARAYDRENPRTAIAHADPERPSRMTGLRPNASEAHPQRNAAENWAAKKEEASIPT